MDDRTKEIAKVYEDMGYTIVAGVNQYLCKAKRYEMWHVVPLLKSNGRTKEKRIYVWALKDLRSQAGIDSLDKALLGMDREDKRFQIFTDKRQKIVDFLAGKVAKNVGGRPRKAPEQPI